MKNGVNLPAWVESGGEQNDVVITSRVRLARNLKGYAFPHHSTREVKQEIMGKFRDLIMENSFFSDYTWADFSILSPLERQRLLEEYVISQRFTSEAGTGRGLAYNEGMNESMMINEEDHLRLQVLEPGLQLNKCWERANNIDDEVEARLDYAFSEDFGFHCACVNNIGTAMRVSAMLHLPALHKVKEMNEIALYLSRAGYIIRGVFGEGSRVMGNIVQVSNIWGIVNSETEIIEKFEGLIKRLIDKEKNTREVLLFEAKNKVYDKIFRDFAILKYSRLLSLEELVGRLSQVRMGVEMGILPRIPGSVMNRLLITARPSFVKSIYDMKENSSNEAVDKARADMVRETLADY